jgi:hypothetical protein
MWCYRDSHPNVKAEELEVLSGVRGAVEEVQLMMRKREREGAAAMMEERHDILKTIALE